MSPLHDAAAAQIADMLRSGPTTQLVGVGVDCEEFDAVARADAMGGDRRRERLFTRSELEAIGDNLGRQASRFAAKEAVSKAIGTGFRQRISPRHIEIISAPNGAPEVRLHGRAAEVARAEGIKRCMVTWSRTSREVLAVALAVGGSDRRRPVSNDLEEWL